MSDEAFSALIATVGAFHITDRTMKSAQANAEAARAAGPVDGKTREAYLRAVRRYFSAFESEARAHLRDVDARLESIRQVEFNLSAERGVAVKRIEATRAVLEQADALEAAGT
jgi:hypothetical protein